jgi:hypothetical protein
MFDTGISFGSQRMHWNPYIFYLDLDLDLFAHLIPEGVHNILAQRAGVLRAVLVGVEPRQYLRPKIFVVERPHFYYLSNFSLS